MAEFTRREVLAAGAGLAAGAAASGWPAGAARAGLSEYERLDATGLAQLVRAGAVRPAELLDEALARLDRWNPVLNAVVIPHIDRAREAARATLRGPLAGVPFLLKNLGTYLAGTVTSEGSRFFRDAVAARTSYAVERYEQAGLVVFGKTASPELGKSPVTESLLWGDTRNPWSPAHTPGGSSGGSAAGIVPAAHGTDGGGLSTVHALTRSVRDSALLLDIARGPEPGGYGGIAPPERPYAEEVLREPGRLRIGLTSR
jgi:amidase